MNIYENVLVELLDDNCNVHTTIRVLWIAPSVTDIVTIELNNPNALPIWHKCGELQTALVEQKVRILEVDPYQDFYRPEDTIPEHHRWRRDEAWEVIAPIVESREQVFLPTFRGALIKKAIERTGPG